MAKRYELSLHELLEILHQYEEYAEEFTGFNEQELEEVENRLGVKLPFFYRNYLKSYGRHAVNDVFNHLNEPEDIQSNYTIIEEEYLDNFGLSTDGLSQAEINARCESDPLFHLSLLPKEQWNTVSKEVVLIWSENQGVWNAGFLKEDLERGVENPPVYYSFDDYVTFSLMAPDTETFLKEMLFFAAWCLEEDIMDVYESHDEIMAYLERTDIDQSRFCQKGMHTCIDMETNELFIYLNSNGLECLIVPYEEEEEDE